MPAGPLGLSPKKIGEDIAKETAKDWKGLRVTGVRGAEGIFELTWAPDGRATFSYGKSIGGSEPHIVWRRVGTHEVIG